VNVLGCVHFADFAQQSGVVEYINSELIVKDDPRTGDLVVVDEEQKIKV